MAYTANVVKDDHSICYEIGMNDILTKPIDEEQLAAVVANGCRRPGVRRTR
ncbi:response regulator [Paenibacillus cymbidii]|uniref:hypothetical protein n=1 Tax=Paenibacillus cymbidii TaxID=1639034 RepID=UPI001436B1B7|nr:hypothetical protein [Paenibacillus cymbidii]